MRDCPNAEFRDQLPDLLHDRLAPAAAASVRGHVAACDDCAAELALLRALREATSVAPSVSVDAIVAALPRAPGAAGAVRSLRVVPRRRWGAWGTAAGGLLAAGLGTVMLLSPETVSPPAAPGGTPAATAAALPGAGGGVAAGSSIAPGTPRGGNAASAIDLAAGAARRELAPGADLTELGEAGLEELAAQLESLDALPSLEPEEAEVVVATGGES